MSDTDKEIRILENIYSKPQSVRQRDLAHIAGISLGMTNSILKRLIGKGFLSAKKINHRNIHYVVTPAGINEIMKRSYRYIKRTIKNIAVYKEKIDSIVTEIKTMGYNRIALVGKSDIDFIVEHCCSHHGISFYYFRDINAVLPSYQGSQENGVSQTDKKTFFILSENYKNNTFIASECYISLFDRLKDL